MGTMKVMFQGTASDSGKSWTAAALCRILANRGLKVAPFKSQNMALNSGITQAGDEMGRAQIFQAEAARVQPDVRMNPILLKPSTDQDSQVVILGKVHGNMGASEYYRFKPQLKPKVTQIFQDLAAENDAVILEGAGSPAEINLNENDIVNMGMAKIAHAPVILVADIDKGGVFAAIYGTIKLLPPEDQRRFKGIIINKFRGDVALLKPGIKMIEALTNVPVLGVLPMMAVDLDDEDSVSLTHKSHQRDQRKAIDVAVIVPAKISNFTDFRSLEIQPDVSVRYVCNAEELGTPDLVILPGSKNTNEDIADLKRRHLVAAIQRAHEAGSQIVGICGGYQMLGRSLKDPQNVESDLSSQTGIGLLNIETVFTESKTTTQAEAMQGTFHLKGYEIHMGATHLSSGTRPFSKIIATNGEAVQRDDGAVNEDGSVFGTYLHGLFDNVDWTRDFLNQIRIKKGLAPLAEEDDQAFAIYKDQQYEKLAAIFEDNIDMKKLDEILAASRTD